MAESHIQAIQVEVKATITISASEARVLAHLLSYDLADYFTEKCNKGEIPNAEIKSVLTALRGSINQINGAVEKAVFDLKRASQTSTKES